MLRLPSNGTEFLVLEIRETLLRRAQPAELAIDFHGGFESERAPPRLQLVRWYLMVGYDVLVRAPVISAE